MGEMRVRFWGVRGSIPVPGPDTSLYGGNTACIEIRCADRLVILDAGSGLRAFGRTLSGHGPLDADLLLTHCHVDHLIGLPFFAPAFDRSTSLRFWAGHLSAQDKLGEILAQFMIPPLLPITPETFRADLTYRDFPAGDTLDLGGGISVATAPLNHPGGATGYRVTFGDHAVAYVSDHEHDPEGPSPALLELVRGADLMIYDATYTDTEYASRKGWGHSTWQEAVRLADAGQVGRVALFHHLPERVDAELAALERDAAALRPGTFAAREGLELVFGAAEQAGPHADPAPGSGSPEPSGETRGQAMPSAGLRDDRSGNTR